MLTTFLQLCLSFNFLNDVLMNRDCFFLIEIQLTYNIIFKCATQWHKIFMAYTPFIVIIKYCLYSWAIRYSPVASDFVNSSLCFLFPYPYLAPPTFSGNHLLLYTSESACFFVMFHQFVFFFQIQHISDNKEYFSFSV